MQMGLLLSPIPPLPTPLVWNPFPLEVKYHHVNVTIQDETAFTSIDQVFYNPTGNRLEGYYIFPVPHDALIKKFSMYINGKEVEAELLDAKKANQLYNDIVSKIKDPALLQYYDQDLFRVKIFPIEPYSQKRNKNILSSNFNKR